MGRHTSKKTLVNDVDSNLVWSHFHFTCGQSDHDSPNLPWSFLHDFRGSDNWSRHIQRDGAVKIDCLRVVSRIRFTAASDAVK